MVTDNQNIEYQSHQLERQKRIQERFNEKYKEQDPHNDPHMKNTDPYYTIFIDRLLYNIKELELQNIFSKYGNIDRVRKVKKIIEE